MVPDFWFGSFVHSRLDVHELTVAICTWNRADLLDRTLAQLRTLRVPAGLMWELLVVDNNCTDHTRAVLARHAGSLPLVPLREPRQAQARRQVLLSRLSGRADADALGDDPFCPSGSRTRAVACLAQMCGLRHLEHSGDCPGSDIHNPMNKPAAFISCARRDDAAYGRRITGLRERLQRMVAAAIA